ncbi:MAG: ArsR family transcriptional regulator [Clostridiales bacterium]|nr:ArsR family transcriptional regulator [Clostridiales bacterium]MCF8023007.1 ArsR family transcriptional regulator [Clostridiales bacterium]
MKDNTKVSKALSDPIRYKILLMLANSEKGCCPLPGKNNSRPGLCNCEIMAELGLIQSKISYHIKELVEAGLVTEETHGKWRYYFINTDNLKQYIKDLSNNFDLNRE